MERKFCSFAYWRCFVFLMFVFRFCRAQVSEVVDFVRNLQGCADYADDFALQEIDGQALMLLKADHLMTAMSMKLGPALKICAKIDAMRSVSSPEANNAPAPIANAPAGGANRSTPWNSDDHIALTCILFCPYYANTSIFIHDLSCIFNYKNYEKREIHVLLM